MTPVQSWKTFHKIRKLPYKPEFIYDSDMKRCIFCIENPDININVYKNDDEENKKEPDQKDAEVDAILGGVFHDYEELKAEFSDQYGLLISDRSGRNDLAQNDLTHGLLACAVYHMYDRRESNQKDIFQQIGLVSEIKSLNIKPTVKETDEFGYPTHFSLAADGVKLDVYKKVFNDIEYYSMKINDNVVLLKSPREYASDSYDAKKVFDYYSKSLSISNIQKYSLFYKIAKSDIRVKQSDSEKYHTTPDGTSICYYSDYSISLNTLTVVAEKVREVMDKETHKGEQTKIRYNLVIKDRFGKEIRQERSLYARLLHNIMHRKWVNQK